MYEFLLEQFLGCFSSCAAHTLLTNLTWTNCDGFWFEIILAIQSLRIRVAIQSLRIVCNMISMYDCIGYCNMQIFSLVVWVGYTVKHNGIKYWWHYYSQVQTHILSYKKMSRCHDKVASYLFMPFGFWFFPIVERNKIVCYSNE